MTFLGLLTANFKTGNLEEIEICLNIYRNLIFSFLLFTKKRIHLAGLIQECF